MRPDPILTHHLAENAFPQTPVGDAQSLGREMLADRLEDRAAGEHEIGALMADAGVGGSLSVAHRPQTRDSVVDLRPAEPEPVYSAPVVARQIEVDASDGRYGSGGAEKVKPVAARLIRDFGDKGREGLGDVSSHRGECLIGDVNAAELFRQRHDAEFASIPKPPPGRRLPTICRRGAR